MGDARTPFAHRGSPAGYAAEDTGRHGRGRKGPCRLEPQPPPIPDDQASPVVFAARHKDVMQVLSTDQGLQGYPTFSVVPYREAGERISRGFDLIIGTEPGA